MNIYDILGFLSDIGPYALYLTLFIIVAFLAMLIHEMGHFGMARLFKLPVQSVVIGRGRTLKTGISKRSGTRWEWRLYPLGAYVHLAGMEKDEAEQGADTTAFHLRPYWQRMLVIGAGPAINILTPFILFPLFFMSIGQPSAPPVVAGIEIGLVSDEVGLEPGDRFLSMNGQSFGSFKDIWDIAYAKGTVENIYKIQRGNEIYDIAITPGWEKYDDDGITRENARFGINWTHTPYKLKNITSVAGIDTEDDEDRARAELIKHMDRTVIIGLKSVNDENALFRFNLSREYNWGLFDQHDKYYEAVYLGTEKHNFYRQRPLGEAAMEGLQYAAHITGKVLTIPFQLLPVDPAILQDAARVRNPETPIANELYMMIYKLSLISVFLAMINLVPFPGLDGGYIMIATAERLHKKTLSRKIKARFFAIGFLIVYAAIALSNLDNLPRYIDSSSKKFLKFIA